VSFNDAQVFDEEGAEVSNKPTESGLFGGWFGQKEKKLQPGEGDLAQSQISAFTEEERKREPMVSKEEQRRLQQEQLKRARHSEVAEKQEESARDAYMPSTLGTRPGAYDGRGALPPVVLPQIPYKMRAGESQESARVKMETIVIKNLISSYFDLTKKNIADMVPKTIMAFLVNESKRIAQNELVDKIYKQGDFDNLIVEDPMVKASRTNCTRVIKALKTAQGLLGEVTQHK